MCGKSCKKEQEKSPVPLCGKLLRGGDNSKADSRISRIATEPPSLSNSRGLLRKGGYGSPGTSSREGSGGDTFLSVKHLLCKHEDPSAIQESM